MSENDANSTRPYRGWAYAEYGDYHKQLDPNWSYTPTYLRKMSCVRKLIEALSGEARILDVACGEGVLVEEFRQRGMCIEGLDLNYESELVKRGDVRHMPFNDQSFDAVVFLDALEHLSFDDQPKALAEIRRVLVPEGLLIMSVPNMAHLNSRMRLLVKGALDRTDRETDHPGERPLAEYERLLRESDLLLERRIGVTFTMPFLYRQLICRHPARLRWVHDLMEPLARLLPGLAMLDILVCRKAIAPQQVQVCRSVSRRIERQSGHRDIFSVPTHLTERERALLFDRARELVGKPVIVEIGSYLGASTCFLAGGICQEEGQVHAVDTWANDGMTEGKRDTYESFLRNTAPLKDWIVPIRSRSEDLAGKFEQPIDLLFLDGDHSYEAVRRDLELWLPKVKQGGTVILHDYGWSDEVKRAARELLVPIQVEGGRRLDSLYWTRVSRPRATARGPQLAASVIVPTYSRPKLLRDALASLVCQEEVEDGYEVLVVDNKPEGEVRAIVREFEGRSPCPVSYIEEPAVGLHNARHAGARAARGRILAYVDDDVIAPPGWLKGLLAPFADPEVGIVAGKILPKWEAPRPPWLPLFPGSYLSILDMGTTSREIAWPKTVYGANMAIRRSVLFESGGFNPDAIGEAKLIWQRGDGETGLNEKVYELHYRAIYEPAGWLWHRITADRLQARAFYRRGFLQGLSMSYSRIRKRWGRGLFRLKTAYRGMRALASAAACCCRAVMRPARRIRHISDAWMYYGFGVQHLRTVFSRSLREFILKDCYLTDSARPCHPGATASACSNLNGRC